MFELLLALALLANDEALVQKLGNDEFEVREKASLDLSHRGKLAILPIQAGTANKDAEIARRCRDLVEAITTKETQKVRDCTVRIGNDYNWGSGTVVKSTDEKTYILSYGQKESKMWVEYKEKKYEATLIKNDDNKAVYVIDKGNLPVARFYDKELKTTKLYHAGYNQDGQWLVEGKLVVKEQEKIAHLRVTYGNGGAGVFVMDDYEMFYVAMVQAMYTEGDTCEVSYFDEIAKFLEDVSMP